MPKNGTISRRHAVTLLLVLVALMAIGLPDLVNGKPLCNKWFELKYAKSNRNALDEARFFVPKSWLSLENRSPLSKSGDLFIFSNVYEVDEAEQLLLVLPGSGFFPAHLLELISPIVPESTIVMVFEYPYLNPNSNVEENFMLSDEIASRLTAGVSEYVISKKINRTGVYATSLGGSILSKMLELGETFDFVVLDGIRESRPLPIVCSRHGWPKDVVPKVADDIPIMLITNRLDWKERSKRLRKLAKKDALQVYSLDLAHPWEDSSEDDARKVFLEELFSELF